MLIIWHYFGDFRNAQSHFHQICDGMNRLNVTNYAFLFHQTIQAYAHDLTMCAVGPGCHPSLHPLYAPNLFYFLKRCRYLYCFQFQQDFSKLFIA